VELAKQVWSQVDGSAHLVIPLGSTEQHGPHLPMDTDSRIAEAVAQAAASQTGATVAPVLAYGASGEHAGFPGTLSIGTEVLQTVLVELVRSAALTFDKIMFVNGHGGNHSGLTAAADQMTSEGHNVSLWFPKLAGGDAHAGRTETSLMLAIAPETVQIAQAEAGNTAPVRDLLAKMQASGVASVSPNGVLGDPAGATALEGRQMLEFLVADLIEHLRTA